MSDSSSFISCLFCLKKTSNLKNKLTADVLKDLDLFKFLCKYLIHQNDLDSSISFSFDSIEDEILPVCTKCANLYKQLAELYSEFQELETQIKSVVEEFREFVLSSLSSQSGFQDGLDTSDFHRSFRQQILQIQQREEFNPEMNIKEEVVEPDELEIETTDLIGISLVESKYKVDPIAEHFDNTNDDDMDFSHDNDDQMDQEEGNWKTDDYIFEEPRRSLRSRDVSLLTPVIVKPKKVRAKNREKVTKVKATKKVTKIEPTSDSRINSTADLLESNNSTTPEIKKRGRPIGIPKRKRKKKGTGVKLTLQYRKKRQPKRYICSLTSCGIELDDRIKLRKHLNQHEVTMPDEEKNLCCTYCQKKFIIQKLFDHHVNLHKLEEDKSQEVWICKLCDVRCKNEENFNIHMTNFHQKGVIKFICNICGKQFSTKCGFKVHVNAHAGIKQKPNRCKYCAEEFVHNNQLQQHVYNIHPEHAKVYTCKFCGNKYYRNSVLKAHLVSHSLEKTVECTVCHEKFKSGTGLDGHMVRSHGKEHYVCEICEDKKFISITGLQLHNRIHHNPEKLNLHDCTQCEKKFTSKSKLDRHILSHGEARNSICEVCGKGFKSPDTLYNHMETHVEDGNKRYKCEICHKTFSWHTSRRVHMKAHHGIETSKSKRKRSTSATTTTDTKSVPDLALTSNVVPENIAIAPTHDPNLMNLSSHMPSLYFNYY